MKPITKVYAYKNKRTGELCGKLFVKKPTSELYQGYDRSSGIYELVECVVIEKKDNGFLDKMMELIKDYEK